MTNPQDIDKAFSTEFPQARLFEMGWSPGDHRRLLDFYRAGWTAALRAVQEPVAPIGWLVRGGGGPLTPVEDGYDVWHYRHGPSEPYLAWTRQEKMPVYAAGQPGPDRSAEHLDLTGGPSP